MILFSAFGGNLAVAEAPAVVDEVDCRTFDISHTPTFSSRYLGFAHGMWLKKFRLLISYLYYEVRALNYRLNLLSEVSR
jgi:hypothetical protein